MNTPEEPEPRPRGCPKCMCEPPMHDRDCPLEPGDYGYEPDYNPPQGI